MKILSKLGNAAMLAVAGYEVGDKVIKHEPKIEYVTVKVPTLVPNEQVSISDILWPFFLTILIVVLIVIIREIINKCIKRSIRQDNFGTVTYRAHPQGAPQVHIQPNAPQPNAQIPRNL